MGEIVTVYRIVNHCDGGFYHDGFYGRFPAIRYWYPQVKGLHGYALQDAIDDLHPHIPNR